MTARLEPAPYLDTSLPVETRARDLIGRMTLEEKILQLVNRAPALDRLGVPAHDYWNECVHGVARAGIATVFPQAIGLAATWDAPLMHRIAIAISDEARAKHHDAIRKGQRGQYTGLTCWSPNINLFRDPRWGRGQETYGEDPHLAGRLAVAFVRGLQGEHPRYLKLVATPKHFAAHSGPERERHRFDVRATAHDLRDSYLPHFEEAVVEGRAASVMAAYTRLNGAPCSCDPWLLGEVLRGEWGFQGFVVSDCGAIDDLFGGHKVVERQEQASARALRAGCDLECGGIYKRSLAEAIQQGLATEADVDRALERVMQARIRLGVFDPDEENPYSKIPMSVVDCDAHRALAREAARRSIVLLENGRGLLPLAPAIRRIAVIGPNADAMDVLLGNYSGTPSRASTLLQGLREGAPSGVTVEYAKGCEIAGASRAGFAEAVALARRSDVVVLAVGLSPRYEGEEDDPMLAAGSGDRADLGLPGLQGTLLEEVAATGTPVVLALVGGGALAPSHPEHAAAIFAVWYPGEEGGSAFADLLFGRESPSGRLPVTFYRSAADLPEFGDYSMENRTYRYFRGEPWFPFGHGLGYTRFRYVQATVDPVEPVAGQAVKVRVLVENAGERAGEEVVQVYVRDEEATVPVPIRSLAAFARVRLGPGEKKALTLDLPAKAFSIVGPDGRRFVEPGWFQLSIGGGQPKAGAAAGDGIALRVAVAAR